ncbi:MAG: HEAT repeat domain-containing protein [Planctomycetaceae bacterium]
MKWISTLTITAAVACLAHSSHAGLFATQGATKSCECGEGCQPNGCRPSVARPCTTTIYSYQRKDSNIKPPCCEIAPHFMAGSGRAVQQPGCGDVIACRPCRNENGECSSEPAATARHQQCCSASSCGQANRCGNTGCGNTGCSRGECCEIAQLIYEAMTACYATERRNAIHRLGDRYDCVCHPEIMNAFIYALNDSDERVRSKAADEIGDQVRRNRCILGNPVVRALRQSLADCDRRVRRQAEQALTVSGFDIVDAGTQCPYPDRCWTSDGCQSQSRPNQSSADTTLTASATKPEIKQISAVMERTSGSAARPEGTPQPLSVSRTPVSATFASPDLLKQKFEGAAKAESQAASQTDMQTAPAPSAPRKPKPALPSRPL